MERRTIQPRAEWRAIVESQGLTYHTVDGHVYWDESAYYVFSERDASRLENATNAVHAMCLEAAEWLVKTDSLDLVGIPKSAHGVVAESWRRGDASLYGRFDFAYDGHGEPKLLEYNADTPTSLVESAVTQWYWLKDVLPELDQFNTIHEKLVERWKALAGGVTTLHASCVYRSDEDWMTVTYLRDAAMQAGLRTVPLAVEDIGWKAITGGFVGEGDEPIDLIFKLYPWEWMFGEDFAAHLRDARTRWVEPAWKAMLSNKALLAVLWELFPESPYLLEASLTAIGGDHVVKPVHSREGSNVRLVRAGRVVQETDGPYGGGSVIYQRAAAVRSFGGKWPTVGTWVVGDEMAGIGVREDSLPVVRNTSSFVPHVYVEE